MREILTIQDFDRFFPTAVTLNPFGKAPNGYSGKENSAQKASVTMLMVFAAISCWSFRRTNSF